MLMYPLHLKHRYFLNINAMIFKYYLKIPSLRHDLSTRSFLLRNYTFMWQEFIKNNRKFICITISHDTVIQLL